MKENYRELFEAKIVKSVGGLALIAKVIVEGYLSGLNKSRKIGYGMEFSQYRGYEPGDDLRLLDWKMLARSGRYYIKQSDRLGLPWLHNATSTFTFQDSIMRRNKDDKFKN